MLKESTCLLESLWSLITLSVPLVGLQKSNWHYWSAPVFINLIMLKGILTNVIFCTDHLGDYGGMRQCRLSSPGQNLTTRLILHPLQDRVLTVRENARLHGFPDYYKLYGPIKQRYMQLGDAVAVPVGGTLGYGLAKASQAEVDDGPLFTLPTGFPSMQERSSPTSSQDQF